MDARRVTIAVAVVVSGEDVLVGRRAADAADAPGCLEFPGGLVEPGESPAAAAVRECREESGVEVAACDMLGRAESASSRGTAEILFFLCSAASPAEPRPPFVWSAIANLDARLFPAANGAVLARLAARGPAEPHGGSTPPALQG